MNQVCLVCASLLRGGMISELQVVGRGPGRLLVVTDAWRPQVNGVVQTYLWLQQVLPAMGIDLHFLTPERFKTIGMPTYPEIRLSLTSGKTVAGIIDQINPDYIHIATEGPLGWYARRHCKASGKLFTTCYHTRFPEYIRARFPVPLGLSYGVVRRFHNVARTTLVATGELRSELSARGFRNVRHWRRGVDVELFRNGPVADFDLPRPWFLFVGRLAVEKNMQGFLGLDLPGSKIIVGGGPARSALERAFPKTLFLGERHGQDLASVYRAADVFVFPSKTDTFGLVMAEALAAGTPVAAFPGPGARAIFGGARCGVLDEDLQSAALAALQCDRDICRAVGAQHSIEASARCFLDIVQQAHDTEPYLQGENI